ncbi:hypothetical protein [Aquabacter spiritensis]|uniref:Uncharacterized protein n=1 Tax=Aquabacter spiritensis TaxID=933073 RepID=A0A4R3M0I2_9HYPH|nr:hypothetical protein [Aquabacter spiritensis]TCT06223.1 hypothetical protein EDC64_103327 [Aquabacter spiritensis]
MDMPDLPTYPALGFLVKHGKWLSLLVAALPLLGGLAAVLSGGPLLLLAAGLVLAPLLLLFMLTYVEMARVISDTMIPR